MSDGKILKLVGVGPPSPVDADVIEALEELLAKAKAGHFNGIAVATVTSEGTGKYSTTASLWAGDGIVNNAQTALGAVEVLKARMLQKLFEWDEDEPFPYNIA